MTRSAAMRDAVERVRSSEGLRRRFAMTYRGRHHPDDALDWLIDSRAMSRRGTLPPPGIPDRSAIYQRGSTVDVHQLENAASVIEQDRSDAENAVNAVVAESRARRGRWRLGAVLALVAVGASAAFAIGRVASTNRTLRAEAASAIVEDGGREAPEGFFSRFPDRLPAEWRDDLPVSATQLDGARVVIVPLPRRRTRLLLVVACGKEDRSYEYTVDTVDDVSSDSHGYGACGALHGVQARVPVTARSVRVLVVTRGIDPFALSVYSR